MKIKKLPDRIDKVHYFNIIKIANDCFGKHNVILECNCEICMTYYFHNIHFNNKKDYEHMSDFKNVLIYFIKNSRSIIHYTKIPFKKSDNHYYELYYGKTYCGDLIIKSNMKKNAKDFLKEILLSKYGIRIRS